MTSEEWRVEWAVRLCKFMLWGFLLVAILCSNPLNVVMVALALFALWKVIYYYKDL